MVKKIAIALLIIISGFALFLWIVSESKPESKKGPKADELAQKMLDALNHEAYDSAEVIHWNFKGMHQYSWNKKANTVKVSWDNIEIDLNIAAKTGEVKVDGQSKPDTQLVAKGLEYFYNDSFWLVAPYKVFDEGTTRGIVETEEGTALMVTFTSGGATPGDSYLWFLDEKGFPKKYKMWVNIIPVGGLEFTWEDWKQFGNVWLPQNHKGLIKVEMTNIKVFQGIKEP